MSLETSVSLKTRAFLAATGDHGSPRADLTLAVDFALANGTGPNQASKVFSDQRTLIASATEDLDLAGALTNALGEATVFATVKHLFIKAAAGNTNSVVIGNGTAGWVGWFGAVTHTLSLPPSGFVALGAPVAGLAVTPTTADILTITNSAGTTPVTYDIMIIGT